MADATGAGAGEWESFTRDAAQTIRAREQFERESANVLDAPWDPKGHERLRNALAQLQDAVPAARRISQLRTVGAVA